MGWPSTGHWFGWAARVPVFWPLAGLVWAGRWLVMDCPRDGVDWAGVALVWAWTGGL